MPELPDVCLYLEHLERRVRNRPLERVRLTSASLLRTVEPPLARAQGRRVVSLERLGKRLVLGLEGELFLVVHLMVAGRLHWRRRGAPVPRRRGHAAFDFPEGSLVLTEASPKKRATLHVVAGRAGLADHDPGGLEVRASDAGAFAERLASESHTLKRALTDPRLFSGIGGAYADEILHAARLSPVRLTGQLAPAEVERLHAAAVRVLTDWTRRLRAECGEAWPERVTAFRPGMAVHGRYRQPCPACGSPVQRIVYAETETNYCPSCQTGGRLLADRALSRLLRRDWPRSLEALEARRAKASRAPRGRGGG